MIKVKDGYAKLVGATASGSASHILLSNGGVKAVSDFAAASALDNYLPLSGGTMNGVITMPINYQIQWGSSSMMIYGEDTNAIKIVAPLGLYVNSKEVWHSGNDGSGSGLDADLLDGKHATDFMQYSTGGKYVQANLINSELWSLAGGNGYIEYYDSGTWFNSQWGKVTAHYGFEGSLSGNASSATKLQTPRTIWGQSFDGTSDVNGNILLGVGSDYAIGTGYGSSDKRTFNNITIGNSINGIVYNGGTWTASTSFNAHTFITGASSNALVINNGGNVGIGTTSPSSLLHVNGDGRIAGIHFRGSFINLNRDGATSAIYDSTKTALEIEATSSISILRTYNVTNQAYIALHTNGNIGIGTKNPSSKLHVQGVLTLPLNNQVQWADSGGAMIYGTSSKKIIIDGSVGIGTTSPTKKLHIYSDSSSYDSLVLLEKGGAYDVRFELANSIDALRVIQQSSGNAFISLNGNHSLNLETSNTVRFTIDGSGNVGIGTTSPSYKLDVNGNIAATSSVNSVRLIPDADCGIFMKSNGQWLHVAGSGSKMFIYNGEWDSKGQGNYNKGIVINTSNNVGIGTESPVHKLDVNGSIYGSHYYGDAITLYTRGNGTYTRAWITAKDSAGDFIIEAPLTAESSGTRAPITLTWRGGYPSMGGLKITGYSEAVLGGNKIWHAGNDGSGSGLDADLLDGKHLSSFITYELSTDYVGASFNSEDLSKKAASTYIEYWDGTGGWFNSRWGLVLAISGFHRVGSSDSYVLLGGGGHKAVSDFAPASHNHNYFPENTAVYFRDPNASSWRGGMYWGSAGNEALCFAVVNANTSFRFFTGSDLANWTSSTWQGTPSFEVNKNGAYAPHFYESSDIRYKTIINNLAIKANQLANLPLFDFKWLDNEDLLNTGTSAQAVQELLPYIVSGTDKLTLDYGVLGTIAGITACKELTEQEKEINKLKEQIKFLKDEINNLKTNKLWQS